MSFLLIMDKNKYPIGVFEMPQMITQEQITTYIKELWQFPYLLEEAVAAYPPNILNLTYREGGWTIAQIVHHLADVNMNSFIRCKLALTEENPIVKPYEETLWATISEARDFYIASSLYIINGVHWRWYNLLKSLSPQDFEKTYRNPQSGQTVSIKQEIVKSVWHGKHHLAHIKLAKEIRIVSRIL